MAQTVIIDSNNVVRVVDSGPVGPPGFGASDPTELLPLAISRQAPWSGWVQFNGMPLATQALYGLRQAMAFAAVPLMTGVLESTGVAPIYASSGQEIQMSVTGFGVDYTTGLYPEDHTLRVTATTVNMTSGEWGPEEVILLEGPLLPATFTNLPTENELDSLLDEATIRSSFTLPAGTGILFLRIDVLDGDGLLMDLEASPELLSLNLALHRVSMWEGALAATPRVDPNSGHTWFGMQNTTHSAARMVSYVEDKQIDTMLIGGGMYSAYQRFTDLISMGSPLTTSFELQVDDEEDPTALHWSTPRLRVTSAPVHDHDVARLIDLTGEIQKLAAQETAPTVDGVLPITTAELTIPTNDQEFTIPNPGIGRSATFTITFSNTSGSTKFVDFVPVPNNYGGGSGASGFADGTNRRFVMVVTGGASAPSVDMVEI